MSPQLHGVTFSHKERNRRALAILITPVDTGGSQHGGPMQSSLTLNSLPRASRVPCCCAPLPHKQLNHAVSTLSQEEDQLAPPDPDSTVTQQVPTPSTPALPLQQVFLFPSPRHWSFCAPKPWTSTPYVPTPWTLMQLSVSVPVSSISGAIVVLQDLSS